MLGRFMCQQADTPVDLIYTFMTDHPSAQQGVSTVCFPSFHERSCCRCVFKSSAMGQANAARDKLYDLRECDMRWVACDKGRLMTAHVPCVLIARDAVGFTTF